MADLEQWQSNIRGRIGIIRVDSEGRQRTQLVLGGARFSLSPQERQITEQNAVEGRNPFMNGQFSPVQLVESAEDYDRVNNSGALSDSDIDEMLSIANHQTFLKALKEIDSPYTIQRMMERAVEKNSSEPRLQAVRDHLAELGHGTVGGNFGADPVAGGIADGVPEPQTAQLTPQDPQPAPPAQAPPPMK